MKLITLLQQIDRLATDNDISKPYVVGGFPRDVVMSKLSSVKDIDITCGDETSLLLGQFIVKAFDGSVLTTFSDGHSKIIIGGFSIDLSNNFVIPNVQKIIPYAKTPMEMELYSRDFTINTLLMPLDLSTIIDTTNKGIHDIKEKMIDTCLPPQITLGSDPKRIVRLVYLCSKLDMMPSKRVFEWVKKYPQTVAVVKAEYTKRKIGEALDYNKEKTMSLLNQLGLMQYIPESEKLLGAKYNV